MNLVAWILVLLLLLLQPHIHGSLLENTETILMRFLENETSFDAFVNKFKISDEDNLCLSSLQNVGSVAANFLANCTLTDEKCTEPNWAVRLLDALPTKPPGLSRKGPFFFIGDFEVCKDLWTVDEMQVHYCTVKGMVQVGGGQRMSPISAGLCIPSTCKDTHLNRLLLLVKEYVFNQTIHVESIYCADGTDDEWSVKKPYVLFVFFSILALLVVGTLVEKMNREGVIRRSRTKMRRLMNRKSFSPTRSESPCANRSDRTSCGQDTEDDSSVANSSLRRSFAPSIALTYRNLSSIFVSNSLLVDILAAFSVRSSLNHLFRNSTREVKLVNLLRVTSSFWVIFSHTCLFSLHFTDTVRSVAENRGKSARGWKSFMMNSSLAVDTFLFLSACVASYSTRKRLLFRGSDSFSIRRFLSLLGHRCFRLLPALCLYLTFIGVVYNHLADGPFWNTNGMFGTDCNASTLWPHFSFLANFFPSTCVPWLWYISLDFQLYLLLLPLLFFFLSKFRFGWLPVVFLCFTSLTYRSLAYAWYTLPANMFVEMLSGKFEKAEMSFRLLYTSPVSRAPPFLIGILTGWYICQPRFFGSIRSSVSIALKLLAIALLIFSLFGPFSSSDYLIYPHAVIHRTVWALGLAILVTMAQIGHNFGVFKVFSGRRLVVLSRLSFGVYLSHEPILLYYLNTLRQPMSPSSFADFFFIALSVYILSLACAFFIAIAVEVPLLTLERKIFMTIRKAGGEVVKERMERHVSFGDTEIETFEKTEDDAMDPHEKTRQWIEKEKLNLIAEEVHSPSKIEENAKTSTEC
ncbi:unnamed protein product [Caenorhabditis sp. 36 PRJEB53466]|nr:unnamed protein product [Caenorhabditis sp. 36 PRJEB53466]